MPSSTAQRVTYLGLVDFRNDHRRFGIRQQDRRSHMHIIGKTGTGKSTLLATMIRQDMQNGQGLALVDPHGDLVEKVLTFTPENRRKDLIYFNVPDPNLRIGFNPLHAIPKAECALAAADLLDVFKKIWAESWGPRLEHILRNVLLALLDQGEASLADVNRLLGEREYRREVVLHLPNKEVREFWLREYENYPERLRAEAISPIQNKIGAFLANPLLARIITSRDNVIDLQAVMNDGKILLVNLSKGRVGEDTAALLGALLVSRLGRTALHRASIPENQRRDFHLYLDEFQTFSTNSLCQMLSELRKYRLNLVLAHQFLGQLGETLQQAVMGNVGTLIAFRVGANDAEALEAEFRPVFSEPDLINLPNYRACIRLMIDGEVSRPFSALAMPV